ncbi:phosphomannomutase/phosphoglucomutase [bacterium]|nr:phosphomannomutase/phosphoglucomutase [bacterium]
MNFNEKIFKAYDIRGVYEEDFNDDFAYYLGLSYAKLRKEETKKENLNIVVAKDMRLSSDSLHTNLINGLLDSGVNVIDIGLNSTPTFYFAVASLNYDGGIIVSASHNPAKWNGFKIVRERALPIGEETGLEILKKYINDKNLIKEKTQKKGTITENKNVLAEEIDYSLKFIDVNKIKKLRVVIDAANAMGSVYCKNLFKKLPVELIKLNFDLDGNFPNHEADPLKEENLKQLQEKVIKEKADLGIALDGDGDRVFFMDEKGEVINQSIVRGLLAKIFLQDKPGSKIAYDIRPGKITEDLIIENGGIPVLSRVGHSLIKDQSVKEGVYFAGESSGHFFLNMDIGCFEVPMIVILKLLVEFSQQEKKISEYIKPFKKYFLSGEINSQVEDKEKVLKNIQEKYNDGKINLLDGVSVAYPDFWFNVRASNTEEKIRLNLEAVSENIMKEKTEEVLNIIKNEI